MLDIVLDAFQPGADFLINFRSPISGFSLAPLCQKRLHLLQLRKNQGKEEADLPVELFLSQSLFSIRCVRGFQLVREAFPPFLPAVFQAAFAHEEDKVEPIFSQSLPVLPRYAFFRHIVFLLVSP